MIKIKKSIVFVLLSAFILLGADSFKSDWQDGPYIIRENDNLVNITIKDDQVQREILQKNENGEYYLDWSGGRAKEVKLLENFEQPQTEYSIPNNFIVISDIHGNLYGTIELLLNLSVMDSHFNWIYDGWLIIDGDVFDRGEEVTECMWLLYHLWQQAENAEKGKLIPILGNHEIWILGKRTHRVKGKYKTTCELIDATYNELYGKNSLMGNWLRSWQTVLKLGDVLVLHGGVSQGLADRYDNPAEINEIIYDYYRSGEYAEELDYIFGSNGPFWYRGYFYDEEKYEKSDPMIVKKIREQYGIAKIIVGHTTMDDICYVQDNQVIAVDAGLKYQETGTALLYEKGRYFVLASSGEKQELIYKKTE